MNFRDPENGLAHSSVALLPSFQCFLLAACAAPLTVADEPAVVDTAAAGCIDHGQLSADFYGGIRATPVWSADDLECNGMIRPFGEAARLRFTGPLPILDADADQRSLAFILGSPDLQQGETATELPTNVSLAEVGIGGFHDPQDTGNCWTDILSQEQIGAEGSLEYCISGVLYCVGPLAELNGGSSISFADSGFTGQLSWGTPK